MLDRVEVCDLVPYMSADHVAAGLYEPTARDVDVAGLHQAFVRIARRHDARIVPEAGVVGLTRRGSQWRVHTANDTFTCDVIVNASGAWGDQIAELAGIPAIGLEPRRRTAFMVPGSAEYSSSPMVVDVDMNFYVKPDGIQFLCSLGEENPSVPEDPRPRMEDVALAIDRINRATTIGIRSVNSQWTGLRTFAPDGELVAGEEEDAPGFYWLVGQGGTGIATSPAYGKLIANLVLGLPAEGGLAEIETERYSPSRFR